ncbi:hypothetical protein MKK65_29140 [Methylobacterium sp. J-001]|uniref:hypothetical protein n=1 Tax=Methylobacterium sp. J-001 TaxID=2836609 RepID=UPI001FBABE89|nr:hypothetical protein [Methylobacterium sp. J-001]MCJ2120589.1 hypothetical protein [Methylobacterium sp. J-001]
MTHSRAIRATVIRPDAKKNREQIALARDRLNLQRSQLDFEQKIRKLGTASADAINRLAVPKAHLDVP